MPRSADVWADENRILPKGSAEPGPWRSSRVPYTRAICEAAIDPKYKRVIIVCGSQMAKSETMLNIVGHRLGDDPAPVIMVFPTQRLATSVSQSRLMPMIRSTPSLLEKLDQRKSANKVTEKFIAGQRLGLAWAGSATELSSHPAAIILLDEIDRMDADVSGEGDPVSLAEARITTFPSGKVIAASTPTIEGGSRIWSLFESGTQHVWKFACPDCMAYFAPCFDLLKWPEKATPAQAKREARLLCPNCGSLIADRHRTEMNRNGKFEPQGDLESDTASFLVSGLASPWRTFGDAAKSWVEASRSREPERMQSIMNTVFGQLWKLSGEAPEVAAVHALRGGYAMDEIPAGVSLITAGVDLQMDRLVYVVRGWGHGSTSWLIRSGELWGDTAQDEVWQQLSNLLEHPFGDKRIRLMFVDSGYRPDAAYRFSRRYLQRCYPSKGHDQQSKPVYIAKLDVNARGETQRKGVLLAHVDSSYFKAWVHGRIVWPLDQPGAWHLPHDATDDYCAQIIAEQQIVKPNGVVRWVKTKTANHFLDAEVLAAAAAHLLNVHLLKRKASDQAPAVNAASSASAAPSAPAQPQKPKAGTPGWDAPSRRPGGGGRSWVKNW